MEHATAAWLVQYEDSSILYSSDTSSPHYFRRPDGTGEVPYRAIEWPRVRKLVFESPTLGARTEFEFDGVESGQQLNLLSRTWQTANPALDGNEVERPKLQALLLVTTPEGTAITEVGTAAQEVLFWCATGKWHLCHDFNCPTVGLYGNRWSRGLPAELPETCDGSETPA